MSQPDRTAPSEPIPEPLDASGGPSGRNELLLSPTTMDRADQACAEQLRRPDGGPGAVVLVTLTDSPDERLRFLRDHDAESPASVSVVCAGESRRGGSVTSQHGTVRTVKDPGDLARLGVGISDALAEGGDGYSTTVCFHSVTALLQFAELPRVFRFLYTLAGRVASSGARAHYHLDPNAHDEQTVTTLTPLFDSVVEVTEDGVERIS